MDWKTRRMGAFLSHLVGKPLGDRDREGEIDHNIIVCCGTLTVAEHEKDIEQERTEEHEDDD